MEKIKEKDKKERRMKEIKVFLEQSKTVTESIHVYPCTSFRSASGPFRKARAKQRRHFTLLS